MWTGGTGVSIHLFLTIVRLFIHDTSHKPPLCRPSIPTLMISREGLGVVTDAVVCLRNLASFWTEPDENTIRTSKQLAKVPGLADRSVRTIGAMEDTRETSLIGPIKIDDQIMLCFMQT